jgi:hypothetical protein
MSPPGRYGCRFCGAVRQAFLESCNPLSPMSPGGMGKPIRANLPDMPLWRLHPFIEFVD